MSEHFRDSHYTKTHTNAPPSWLLKDPTPEGRHWGQASHDVDDIKINILAFIQRDSEDPQTTLYRAHIEYQRIHKLRTMVPFGINVQIHDPFASSC